MPPVLSIKQRLLEYVRRHPGESAYQMARVLGVQPADLSGLCKRLTDAGVLRRERGRGPRGGFGYFRSK